ncbi:LOW QUALITY PROTEIN: cleft lip and palate transmembrane protein 1 homolog [Manduca sexta]|uniref:LOW QUALITY PROTEIN: cleft lip and palate transmembrane protein 1 homolog n=1 Tax=Manduca sexta TaxID=7130 RepID=UPI00188DF032|nr:LOW QUALITY PROTEIN: cleft lip and palate transmembrane protein 1 homolog [Manduca sexta]
MASNPSGDNPSEDTVAIAEGNEVADASTDINAQVDEERRRMQPTKLESFFAITKSLIIRALVVYFITSMFRQPSAPKPDLSNQSGSVRVPATNMFPNGTNLDLYCYLSDKEFYDEFDKLTLIWTHNGLIYGDWTSGPNNDGTVTFSTEITPSHALRNNGSMYLHVFVVEEGKSPNPKDKFYAGPRIAYGKKMLNKYKKLRYLKTHNLLTGQTEKSEEEIKESETLKEEIVSHWHPNLTINLVTDQTNWMMGSVPPPLDEFIYFLPEGKQYKPAVFLNDYWNMMRDYVPINKTTTNLQLQLTYQPLSLFKWQLYTAQAMRDKLSMFSALGAEEQDEEQDTVKELLLDTSPYLLALTITVSVLHSIFELLAFKNDIQFWNNRQSLEGLSVRSVFFNVFQSTVVLLYVLDNETNVMVRISCFIGLIIEIWKINKVMDVKINREQRVFGIPKITFTDKGSYVESSTKQYDMLAFQYLSWACFPLLIGYGVYSLLYQEHKGWYSFILNMMYGYLLTFGFIMMTPQLFINYKLKSVAHLPWRMMTYKFLNTFIDDIFAFVIKMPTMYRLGCFRDDIVFFIFLYQRWMYKVDHKRVNEFGFSGEMEEQQKLAKNGTSAITESEQEAGDKKND